MLIDTDKSKPRIRLYCLVTIYFQDIISDKKISPCGNKKFRESTKAEEKSPDFRPLVSCESRKRKRPCCLGCPSDFTLIGGALRF